MEFGTFDQLDRGLPLDEFYLMSQFAFRDLSLGETRTSVELFAREVMPAGRQAGLAPAGGSPQNVGVQ